MTFQPAQARPHPPIVENARDLFATRDVLFCDVWGVVHDGHRAYETAGEALVRFRQGGGTVVLVSNAPVPAERVARMLDLRGVRRQAWDAIVSSGDIALRHVAAEGFAKVFCIGPADRDAALFSKLSAASVALADAEAIVCTGLFDDRNDSVEGYTALLAPAAERALPFVCANPDLVVDVGGTLYHCAGAIADLYERMGGPVFWAGKPHAIAYTTAHVEAERLRGRAVERDRVLVIGDSIRTDLTGAAGAGIDALFIAAGIHRDDVMDGGRIVPDKLAALFAAGSPPAIGAMPVLAW